MATMAAISLTPSSLSSVSLQSACSQRHSLNALVAKKSFPSASSAVAVRRLAVSPVAMAEEVATEAPVITKPKKRTVSSEGKQKLVLKFVWMEKNIGLAVDQVIPGQGSVPVSPYMFWPRKDAWEQLKELLESKPWLSRKRIIITLNQATDIINLWQQTMFRP